MQLASVRCCWWLIFRLLLSVAYSAENQKIIPLLPPFNPHLLLPFFLGLPTAHLAAAPPPTKENQTRRTAAATAGAICPYGRIRQSWAVVLSSSVATIIGDGRMTAACLLLLWLSVFLPLLHYSSSRSSDRTT